MTDDNRSERESRRVRIREVGPRDGFQNEPETIPTTDKIRLINALGRAGFKRIEVASFVRPDVIPQLSDGVDQPDLVRGGDGLRFVLEAVAGPDLPDARPPAFSLAAIIVGHHTTSLSARLRSSLSR